MTIFQFRELFGFEGGEMARARKVAPSPNEALINEYADGLAKAALDRAVFDTVLTKLADDDRLRAGDVAAIAQTYARGRRPRSRSDALDAIRKRFIELVRLDANKRNAEKARPW